ncbi:MAG: UDP-N-acetylmuramoyl-L-alanine--D-glutamate ligase [Clostridia bacterium]|nr:UDP-N-acetylmuramoyl-L-alanine--D-glutamate ligase [Clostridia bacterium]
MNERLQSFKNYIKNKKVALIGMGISNRAAVDFLLSSGAILSARDKNSVPDAEMTEFLTSRGVKMIYGEQYLSDITEDIVFKSPGIRYDIPELIEAAQSGTVITSEMEVFTEICPAKIFAVTGSDGKTTTTTLVSKMLEKTAEKTGAKVYLGGNIGTPLLPYVEEMTENDFAVLELSSFQLHTMKTAPVSAIVTNVTPNHLNWHTSMEEYVESKKNIYRDQTENCRLVLNANNEITVSMADEAKAKVTFFAFGHEPENKPCCYFENGTVWYDDGKEKQPVMKREDIRLVGDHNVKNYMAAISCVWGYADVSDMLDIARTFKGVPHRIEFIAEKGDVKFYNSSIDTSPTRTLAALASFKEKLIVIVGGYDKHIPIEPLIAPLAEKAKFVVATGDTGLQVLSALAAHGYPKKDMAYLGDFDAAVRFAANKADEGDTVLLSPAAASFDAFKNFEERGDRFRKIVEKLWSF